MAEFEPFFRRYYRERILELARGYPDDGKALTVDWNDLYQFDPDLADDLRGDPGRVLADAREAVREVDVPVDVDLDEVEIHVADFPDTTDIRDLRADHVHHLVAVRGIIRKATPVRPKVEVAIYECLTCGGEIEVVQRGHELREPTRCPHCERNTQFERFDDRSRFIDSQRLRLQESPEGLRGGETPQNIDIHLEDDLTGRVSPGDRVTATGILRLREQSSGGATSPILDMYIEGNYIEVEEEEFEVMDIEDDDVDEIRELAAREDIYERVIDSIAPSIWGYDDEKLAIALQLFSGVRKPLPDGSRVRGDLHVLLVGDPGTGKCVDGDTAVTRGDGSTVPIRELVEGHLDDPRPVDDGVYDDARGRVRSMAGDGRLTTGRVRRVWKRTAPERMYRIRTADGATLEVTPSHPLFRRGPTPTRADHLCEGDVIAAAGGGGDVRMDGGAVPAAAASTPTVSWVAIDAIETYEPADPWVYDLEVTGTHAYVGNGIVSHNSQLLQYITKIAPRSVYTSGKGASAAGLTASAVRDDFGDGQQWSLEAGALVLADQGVAAVDELDKAEPADRSAMHEALEQQSVSVSKAGINATLQARCALLGAANPTYGRFDQYEPIAEQIDLEPALISRFDLIFTVDDRPEQDRDERIAEHILQSNYAGELNTKQQTQVATGGLEAKLEEATEEVTPAIEPELLRKYVAYATQTCIPTMTMEARERIKDYYMDLRMQGTEGDSPVPMTARKLEAMVRLAEASARIRLSDEVTPADADRAIRLVNTSMRHIGLDPESGEFDVDMIETGTSKSQRDRIRTLKGLLDHLEEEGDFAEGIPLEVITDEAEERGMDTDRVEHEIDQMKQSGEIYEPKHDQFRLA